ncbi:MAG: DUF4304 domain-containing protein [Negativicutes bacterium]|nr:DUF4304 domain-containing protein [Negativicutes bacterium]
MIGKKTFKKAIAEHLEKAGFTKKGQTWYLDGQDVLIATNLQKSDWDEMYYINIGFWLKGLGEAFFPPYNHCHLSYRAERLFPEQRELILIGCSLEKSNLEMLAELSQFIQNLLIPFLRGCTEENKLRELMAKGLLNNGLVFKEARQYLSSTE